MHLARRLVFGTFMCAAAACADADDTSSKSADASGMKPMDAKVAGETSDAASTEAGRPDGWESTSHERGAADYDRLFEEGVVHRIDIAMDAETRAVMLADMEQLLGPPGSGGFGAPPGGGIPPGGGPPGGEGFGPPAELAEACAELSAGASCTIAGSMEGTCMALGGDALACIPAGGPGGFPGGGGPVGGGAVDLIGGDPSYVPVTVKYDGKRWTHVGMRYKGNSSLAGAWGQGKLKLAFRLNFDRYEDEHPEIADQRFYGFSEMTFAPAFGDSSMIRDKLASEILLDRGAKAARAAFYRVYVDVGEGSKYWGLYTMIEDPSDQLAETQFGDDSGNMYKPDGSGATFQQFDEASFDKKSNEGAADFSDVMEAIAALHDREEPTAWRERLERAFDVDAFLRVLAFSRAVGHWDSYGAMPHNYYLYGDPGQQGRLVWISWDHNFTWQGQGGFGGFGGSGSVMMDEVGESWPLIRFLLDDPVYRQRYVEELEHMLQGSYESSEFDARAEELHALIAPYVVGEEGESGEFTHLTDANAFLTSLNDPEAGLLATAEALRAAVAEATAAEQ